MPGYSTLTGLSLTQLYIEDRRQRAHRKKVLDMQRCSSLDNGAPFYLPYLHENFLKHLNEKQEKIGKENEVHSQKLLHIMTTKRIQTPPPFHPTYHACRRQTTDLSESNSEYLTRIDNIKGNYTTREWRKQYGQNRQYLRLVKGSKRFAPLDSGFNRQRLIIANSLYNSKYGTPSLESLNIFHKYDNKKKD